LRRKYVPSFTVYFGYMRGFIYGCISGLGYSRGKNKTKGSNLASMKFLPLSCMEGKELGNGTPIRKLGTGSLPMMLVFNAH